MSGVEHGKGRPGPALLEEAQRTAAQAAEHAGAHVRDLRDPAMLRAVSHVLDEVWARDGRSVGAVVAPDALTGLVQAGGQVSGAFVDDRLVGATAAWIGLADGTAYLHSHVTGVVAAARRRGIGPALKWHQRAWCVQRGIDTVRWTFSPLSRSSAVLNLLRLGARAATYLEDLDGAVEDGPDPRWPADRLLAQWELRSPRVAAAAAGRDAAPRVDSLRRAGAEVAVDVGQDGQPVLTPTTAARRLVRIPADIEAIRHRDPGLARHWADAVRAELGVPMRSGFRVGGFAREGWYVVVADRQVADLKHAP